MIKRIYPRMSTAEFVAKAIAIHGDLYDYSESVYDGLKEPFIFDCKRCGTTRTLSQAGTHIRKNKPCGCGPCRRDVESPCRVCGAKVPSKVYHKTAGKCKECFQEYRRSLSDEWILLAKREIKKNLKLGKWEQKCRRVIASFHRRKQKLNSNTGASFETWEQKTKNQIHRQLQDQGYSAWEKKCKSAAKTLRYRKLKNIPTKQY
jgi:hypothetical protein